MDIADVIQDIQDQFVNCLYHVQVIVLMLNMVSVNWMENVNVKKVLVVKHVEKIQKRKKRRKKKYVRINVIVMENVIIILVYVNVIMDLVVLIVQLYHLLMSINLFGNYLKMMIMNLKQELLM